MMNVQGDYSRPLGNGRNDRIKRDIFFGSDDFHRFGRNALAGILHLCHNFPPQVLP
jgi:hypothetical protein